MSPQRSRSRPTTLGSPGTGWVGVLAGFSGAAAMSLMVVAMAAFALFVAAAFVVYAALCSIVGGVFILVLSRAFVGGRPNWKQSYRAAFLGYLVALVAGALWGWLGPGGGSTLVANPPQPDTIGQIYTSSVMRLFLGWLWPGIPVAAVALAVSSPLYRGAIGLARGLLVSAIALPASLLVPLTLLVGLNQRLIGTQGLDGLGEVLIALLVLLTVYSLLGGLFASPVILASGASLDPLREHSLRAAYGTAILTLLAWGWVTVLVMFFVPAFDRYSAQLFELMRDGHWILGLLSRPGVLMGGLATFGALQLPGVLAGAEVVGLREGPAEPSRGDRQRAFLVTAGAAAVTWPMVLFFAWFVTFFGNP